MLSIIADEITNCTVIMILLFEKAYDSPTLVDLRYKCYILLLMSYIIGMSPSLA